MIGIIRTAREQVRGANSSGRGWRRRRLLGIVFVVVLVALSGYLAATSGAAVAFSAESGADSSGGSAGPAASGAATNASAVVSTVDRPQGFLADGPGDGQQDIDGDSIADGVERSVHGTDPTVRDTDGDGLADGVELACSAAYPDADPLHQDVYVELDSVDGAALSNESVAKLRQVFAEAPVENPDGERGIALHLVGSDHALPEADSVNDDRRPGEYNDVEDYRDDHFQYQSAGYYYLLVSTDVAYNGDDHYAGAGRPGTAAVEHYDRDGVMSSLVLHELGHAFGIGQSMEGVDERKYARDEYPSVMNYNALYEMTTYSDGRDAVGRNEWRYVATERHQPATDRGDGFCPTVG